MATVPGVADAVALRTVPAAMLSGLPARDPTTCALAAIVLIAVTELAGWLPARRASRVSPATVLRSE